MPFRAASCSNQTERVHILGEALGKDWVAFFFSSSSFTSLLLRPSLSVSKPRNPPTKSSYVGRHQNRESLPEQSNARHFAPSSRPKMMGLSSKPLRSLRPDAVLTSFFLAVAPSFSSTLLHPFILDHSLLLPPLCDVTAADPSQSWVLLTFCYFSPCSRL